MTSLVPNPKWRAFDDDGTPLAGGKVFFFEAGTSTPKDTFTDFGGGSANANPVILDSNGEADIWYDTDLYKVRLDRSDDTTRWTVDNVSPGGASGAVLQSVASIAALRLLDADSSTLVDVLGYYAEGDKGGDPFFWDSTNTEIDDSGVTIKPSSNPASGRWVRNFKGDISINDFGAVGDYIAAGVVNPSPTTNDTSVQGAYDYARINNLEVTVPDGSYLLTTFLSIASTTNGEVSGAIVDNAVYGDATWTTGAPNNLSGSCFVWDKSSLAVGDVYIRNVSGADSQDVKFNKMTFYSISSASVGGGKLLVNDASQAGTEFDFGSLETFNDCRIVNFGTTITINLYNTWTVSTILFRGCQQPLLVGNDTPELATNIKVVNCNFENCGDTSTPFISLDNVTAFTFKDCAFETTSEIAIRIAIGQGLMFDTCYIEDASLNSSQEFINVVATAGFDCDNLTFIKCISGGDSGDINLVQGANVATVTLFETSLTGTNIPLGTNNVVVVKLGNNPTISTSGTGKVQIFGDSVFQHTGIGFALDTAERQIKTLTEDASDTESISLSPSGGSTLARGAKIQLFGDDSSGTPCDALISAGTGGAAEGDINLAAGTAKQVKVNGTTDSTSGTTGALISSGGIGAAKNVVASGDVIMDVEGKGIELTEDPSPSFGSNTETNNSRLGISPVTSGSTYVITNSTVTTSTRCMVCFQEAIGASVQSPSAVCTANTITIVVSSGSGTFDVLWVLFEAR